MVLRNAADQNTVSSTVYTDSSANIGLGITPLAAMTTGTYNIAIGQNALSGAVLTGDNNTAIGQNALNMVAGGILNIGIGYQAGDAISTGSSNIAIGDNALGTGPATGSQNVGIGTSSLLALTNGSNNVAVGYQSGLNLTTSSNNINIGFGVSGAAAANNEIRIGNATNSTCYITGITGVVPAATAALALVDTNGQLGAVGAGATGTVLIGTTGANPSFSATPAVTSITAGGAAVLGAAAITTTNTAFDITTGTGAIGISNDAAATAVNVGTGGAAKTVTVGSTTTTSSLALKCGTGDLIVSSATGTLMTVNDTGPVTKPLQPAFAAYQLGDAADVTGDGTVYSYVCGTELFDQGGHYNAGTGVFTAPVTGRYFFNLGVHFIISDANSIFTYLKLVTTATTYQITYTNSFATVTGGAYTNLSHGLFVPMTAGDTAYPTVALAGGTKISDVLGLTTTGCYTTRFEGFLVC